MTTVRLDRLLDALEWVSSDILDNAAFVCRETGTVYWSSGEIGILDEANDLPDDIDDTEKYVPVPGKWDLDLGNRLVFKFAARYLADQYDEVRDIFRRKGAYRRFKVLLVRLKLLEKWYAFGEDQTTIALEFWCESEGLTVEK
jgi:hypothetical protein